MDCKARALIPTFFLFFSFFELGEKLQEVLDAVVTVIFFFPVKTGILYILLVIM